MGGRRVWPAPVSGGGRGPHSPAVTTAGAKKLRDLIRTHEGWWDMTGGKDQKLKLAMINSMTRR